MEDTFKNNLSKLLVLDPASNVIFLFDKCDVFIGDDLFLTNLFIKTFSRPIFVWFPQPSQKTLTRTKLVEIYTRLGVRTLSESVKKNTSDVDHDAFKPVDSKEKINKRGLFKLILAYLVDPNLKIELDKRHEAVSSVLAIEAFETPEKMSKMERASGHKNVIEYASHFAEEIAEGVLWDNEELVPDLCKLIRLGFLLEFDEEAVEFLMKIKNLQIFLEDHDYLTSTFSS
ncbi:unnamed protein product [Lactuca saligna]|nr:unnamed protein product [Lactuca saligna]